MEEDSRLARQLLTMKDENHQDSLRALASFSRQNSRRTKTEIIRAVIRVRQKSQNVDDDPDMPTSKTR